MKSLSQVLARELNPKVVHQENFTTERVLKVFLEKAQHYGYPLAAWQLPQENTQHIILDLSGKAKTLEPDLENLSPGFIYSPFDSDFGDTNTKASFISADLQYHSRSREINFSNIPVGRSEKAIKLNDEIQSTLKDGLSNNFISSQNANKAKDQQFQDKEKFLELVKNAKEAISAGLFKKVVPSRCKYIRLPSGFQLAAIFQKMCNEYPHAFVSLLSVPGLGTWIGASPEILVQTFMQNDARYFRSIALAGTQQFDQEAGLKNASWRIKEIEEQAMVSRYIINCFKRIRLREFEEDGPKTVAAGNLLHLRTDFTVNMDQVNFPELGSVMLKLLHPTSAVCGLPKEPAFEFLRKHEAYERSLFAGFLGPVNIEEQVNIFVNLRCMQLFNEGALLYAGAGVTADSDPENEWQETEIKMQTLQNVLTK